MAKPPTSSTPDVVDTEEIYPEEIPADLLDRVAENHAHLHVIALEVRRNGSWKFLRGGQRTFQEKPPSMSPHDIATLIVRTARVDAENSGTDTAQYRVRLRCRENGREYNRFARVRGRLDGEGTFQIVDDAAGEQDVALRILQTSAEGSQRFMFEAMDKMMGCIRGFADIADTFNKVLGAAGAQWAGQVNSQVELLKVQMEMEQNTHQHAEKMKKWDRGFSLLEKPITRISDEIMETVIGNLKTKRAQQRRERQHARAQGGNGTTVRQVQPRSKHAETLDGIFDDLTEEQIAKVRAELTDEEWKFIEVARRSPSDAHFDATFARFMGKFRERGKEGILAWVARVSDIIGPEGMVELTLLFQRSEQPEAAAPSPG